MLDVELFAATDIENAARVFHRDGFVCIKDALTPEQLETARAGVARIVKEQTDADPELAGNRGHHRYSFGQQAHHPEWVMLLDLPTILPILDAIWQSQDYHCMGAGGDYSLPGAEIQPLHRDMGDMLNDPTGQVTVNDLPTPFIVVNYPTVDFTPARGAIRFIPNTHRTRLRVPPLNEEPQWMKESYVCAPAGTAIIRDVRCWHAGTANVSQDIRPMVSAGYYAPWFRRPDNDKPLPRKLYETLSERGKQICAELVAD